MMRLSSMTGACLSATIAAVLRCTSNAPAVGEGAFIQRMMHYCGRA